jgi:transposase
LRIAQQHEEEQESKKRKYTCQYCGVEGHAANYCSKFLAPVNPAPIQSLKRKPGQAISLGEQCMALHVLHQLIREDELPPAKVSKITSLERASVYTGIAINTLREIYNKFQAAGEVQERENKRGKYEREKHWSRHWISDIREIVLKLNREGMPATLNRIQKGLDLAEYNLKISNWTLAKILKEIGFQYEDTDKAQNFVETQDIIEWRSRYLFERKRIRQLAAEGGVYEVWLDESYCNQHHVAKKSWFREGDTVKRGNKGRRWVIVHAGGRDGWCGEPRVFEARSKSDDYHDNMNSRIFEEYFRDLCEALLERGDRYQKIVFHMDNAKYHKRIEGLSCGLSSLRKGETTNNFYPTIYRYMLALSYR